MSDKPTLTIETSDADLSIDLFRFMEHYKPADPSKTLITLGCVRGGDWHDRPTEPGIWITDVCGVPCAQRYETDGDIKLAEKFYVDGRRFYGPIPPDPKASESDG